MSESIRDLGFGHILENGLGKQSGDSFTDA